jgi:dolichol-phosphate mannosyltransferase
MFEGQRVAVVMPAYNEAAHVGGVIQRMPDYVDLIIVVDDRSTDGTVAAAQAAGDGRVHVVTNKLEQGVGGATVTGMQQALEAQADLIVKVDGDGQMDPQRIAELLRPLVADGYDYAKGNRFLHTDALKQMPKLRLLGSFALTFLTKLASGYWHLFDPQNGFIAARATALRQIDLNSLARDFFFENDMLIRLNVLGCRAKDVAIPAHYGDEESHLRIERILLTFPIYLARGLARRIWEKYVVRDFSPIAVFWLVGVPLLTWGTCFGAYRWFLSWWFGHPASTGTVMLSVLPFLLGFQLVLEAIIQEIRESPR